MAPTTSPVDDDLHAATEQAMRLLTAPARRTIALSYLHQRHIQAHLLPEAWPLGYALRDWTRLTDQLHAQGFTDQVLLDAGLSRRSSRGTLIDVFRDRVVFPIHNQAGHVAGFIGRDLSGAPAAPKYINTRNTPLFTKGTLLYGLHEARHTNPLAGQAVLVEGPLDVIALTTRAGSSGDGDLLPVATCGTAVTAAQAGLIAQINADRDRSVVVAMDGDSAGRTAALAAGEQLRRNGLDVRLAALPAGTDPAEYLSDPTRTLQGFRHASAMPLLPVQVQNCIDVQGDRMQWVEGHLAAARSVAQVLAHYPPEHATAQTGWISEALDIAPATFATALGTAYRDANRLPPADTRLGRLLRAAAQPIRDDRPVPEPDTPAVTRARTLVD